MSHMTALKHTATPDNTKEAGCRGFVKTNIPNLVKWEPAGTNYGRCKVGGKPVRRSLETKEFKVAKEELPHWLMAVRGQITAKEGWCPR